MSKDGDGSTEGMPGVIDAHTARKIAGEFLNMESHRPGDGYAPMKPPSTVKSDGSTASYYELPEGATELQDIISYRNMNAQIGEIFRACMRYGLVEHSPPIRDIKKILFYATAELKRLEKLEEAIEDGSD